MKKAAFGILMIIFCGEAVAAETSSACRDVYLNSTRNLSVSEKYNEELSYHFSRHCEHNGDVRQTSLSGAANIPVDGIPFEFSSNASDNRSKLQEFCKANKNLSTSVSVDNSYRNAVVTAALDSFNKCISLESRGLLITHDEQHPESVIIHGSFKDRTTKATLDTVIYDKTRLLCSSANFNTANRSVTLDETRKFEIPGNFSITCRRLPQRNLNSIEYPRVNIAISTSLGPYSIVLQEDQFFGFTLASEAAEQNKKLKDMHQAEKRRADELEDRLKNISVTTYVWSVGEYDRGTTVRPRHYCKDNAEKRAAALCKGAEYVLKRTGKRGGNKCGYSEYVVACVKK
jgi:hypothetical protein